MSKSHVELVETCYKAIGSHFDKLSETKFIFLNLFHKTFTAVFTCNSISEIEFMMIFETSI